MAERKNKETKEMKTIGYYAEDTMKTTINCCIRCESGKAPTEDVVDAMLRQLQAYAEAKYPNMTKVSERQHWVLDFIFAIFWDLEKIEMKDDSLNDVQAQAAADSVGKSEQLCEDEGCPHNNIAHECVDRQKKPDVIKAALGQQNIYAKEIWNEAIEAAAKLASAWGDYESTEIRSLKK